MKVLVTGAAGYLGRAVVQALRAAGHEPIAMVRDVGSGEIPGAAQIRVAELSDPVALRDAVSGVGAVCHLAGLGRARESVDDPLPFFRVNTGGTVALLEAMAREGVPRIVFASTGAIYGSPQRQPMDEGTPDAPPHSYASSKLAAEFAVEAQARAGAIGAVVVRLMNVAGGADPETTRLIPRVLAASAGESVLHINGDGTAVRDYLHVRDAAAAFVAGVEQCPAPGVSVRYIIGSGCGTSILDVVAAVERVTGRPVRRVHGPAAPEPARLIGDPGKALVELGWAPAHSGLNEIVSDTWRAVSAD
ncbi:NAD-dependent epimerase/dehydratase family protein [Nocardia sp. SYP-A9097]|uniref:NAD-dependent epimerase/dehydratase family protein n=1 Tax=Nocardia sp. SYP-A9097 TaxID=2663237 RepID=UPI00129A1DA1|nr:NAD-dependent epimerase/dehydratase family protein [Nocardia sp. SYP-A9097]MRH89782.1 NAD-dependent epimerase/dehydratase family protein [Nocardia sp. SYP-A9097]